MAVYAIGDVQGCYDQLRRLLDRVKFDPDCDKLWFAGDIVNRGPQSLQTLRFVRGLGKRAVTVLGNHDLHLLALWQGNMKHQGKNHTLDPILEAQDRDELLDWLRRCPLMHRSEKLGFSLIHAGLPPQWDTQYALARAREVESALQGDRFHDFCLGMYGNRPERWSYQLIGMDRLRFITNCFTRLRYCDSDGNLALKEKGAPGSQQKDLLPWYAVPDRASRNERILFGHWSTLGFQQADNTWALDSGCLWGGKLTAVKLRKGKSPKPFQIDCPGSTTPTGGVKPS